MRNRSGLFVVVVFCFAIFLSYSCPTAPVIDGGSVVVGRAIPRPVHELPDTKPPPEVFGGPKPQDVNPASRPKPGFIASRNTINGLLKTKVLYPIYRVLKIDSRPEQGTSGVGLNKGNGKVEFVIGYKDMLSAWEAGRGVVADPTQDIITAFPVTHDPSRDASRKEAMELLISRKNFASTWEWPVDSISVRARAKDGIKYTKYLEQAKEQAFQTGREMSIVRVGMTRKEASTYKPDSLPLLNAPTWAKRRPAPVIRPGDPGWTENMYGYSTGKAGLSLGRSESPSPYDDPYILLQFRDVNWNPPPRPANYHLGPVAPDELPPNARDAVVPRSLLALGRAKPPGVDTFPIRNKRATNLDTLSEWSESGDTENGLADEAAQFKLFYEAFQAVQLNISTLISPFLQTMVNNSNASVVYHAAWNIWAELTMADDILDGPFSSGLNRIAEMEDDYARANNLSTTSDAYKTMLAFDEVLINKYETAWNHSLQAVNASGLLEMRDALADNLQVNGTGIESENITTLNTDFQGIEWFVQYDVPVNVSLNSTSAR